VTSELQNESKYLHLTLANECTEEAVTDGLRLERESEKEHVCACSCQV
jgi:hypothetical protein